MNRYAAVFKTSLGWAAVIHNEKEEVERLFLPTTRQKATAYIKGLTKKRLPAVESRVRDYFDGKRVSFASVALCQNGNTSFEKSVYKALRKIPYGTVISYSDLAAKAGSKGAARAAGTAMSKNRLPLIIPCHRVIRSDGSVGKFTSDGGAPLKRKMLSLEGKV
ncbi:MAG: methylated-DNA--[protein]-cysteine S-methyltransferase [Nitrospinota bacterium]